MEVIKEIAGWIIGLVIFILALAAKIVFSGLFLGCVLAVALRIKPYADKAIDTLIGKAKDEGEVVINVPEELAK